MLSLEQLLGRLAEKGYRHRQIETLLRSVEGAVVPPEVLARVERMLEFDSEQAFLVWFGERHYKAHQRQAIIECGTGALRSRIDYLRRME
jgi:hypothetical protein